MSTIEEPGATTQAVPALTFKERLAQRRRELESNANFEIAVPGYQDLWARYRVLGYEEIRGIGVRVEEETDDSISRERLTAASTLAEACVELLELKGRDHANKPVFESTGCRWSATAARDFFEVDLPEGVVARDAVMAIFPYPRDMLMMSHFEDYLAESMGYLPELEKVLQGESPAASAATTSVSSQPLPWQESQ